MCIYHLADCKICTFAEKSLIYALRMQYTNVYSPKPTYYFYHAICCIKREH